MATTAISDSYMSKDKDVDIKGRHESRGRSRSPIREPSSRDREYGSRARKDRSVDRARSGSPAKDHARRSVSPSPSRHRPSRRSHRRRRSGSPPSRSPSRGRYQRRNRSSSRNRYRVRSRTPPKPTSQLGVFGIAPQARERDFEEMFAKWGPLEKITVVTDRESGRSKFAFLNFDSVEAATEALNATNGIEMDGRRIRVDYSRTNGPHDPTPGRYQGKKSYGGGYRGRRYSRSPSRSPPRRRYASRSRSRSLSPRH